MRFLPTLFRLVFTTFFWVTLQSTLFAQEEESLAVLDLEGRGISQPEAISLSDRLRAALVRTGKLRIIERGQMEAVLREQDFNLTGCTSNECAVEVGELLGVTHMLAGTIGKVGSMFSIDFRVVSVASGQIVQSISKDYQGQIEGLLGLMTVIANDFVGLEIAQEAISQQNFVPNEADDKKLSAENTNSLTTVDEIYDSISEDDLNSFSIGDSVYVVTMFFGRYSWDAALIIGINTKNKSRIQVELNGETKMKSANRLVKKYSWLVPYMDGFSGDFLEIGDKVIASTLKNGTIKGVVAKIARNNMVTLETKRIVRGIKKISTQRLGVGAIAMIRVPEE